MPNTLSNLEDEKPPNSPKVANPFATVNRISVGLLLVGCVGFAIAIAGYITEFLLVGGSRQLRRIGDDSGLDCSKFIRVGSYHPHCSQRAAEPEEFEIRFRT